MYICVCCGRMSDDRCRSSICHMAQRESEAHSGSSQHVLRCMADSRWIATAIRHATSVTDTSPVAPPSGRTDRLADAWGGFWASLKILTHRSAASCHAGAPEESAAPARLHTASTVRCENRRALRAEPHSLCPAHTAIHTIAAHRIPLRASCDFYDPVPAPA